MYIVLCIRVVLLRKIINYHTASLFSPVKESSKQYLEQIAEDIFHCICLAFKVIIPEKSLCVCRA